MDKMKNKTTVCGIVAIGPDDVIGQNGRMPWYSKQDFYHFKNMTIPFPCVFGKNTFNGLPRRPLPNRLNIVCSSEYSNKFVNGVFYADTLETAIEQCKVFDYMFICGGAKVYKYALNHDLIDIMYITKIYDEKLSQDIKSGCFEYTRFPMNTNVFFDSEQWVAKRIIYNQDVLPLEKTNAVSKFFKCIRAR